MTKRQLDVVGTRSRPAGGGGPCGSANADGRVARAAVRSVGVLLALVLSSMSTWKKNLPRTPGTP